MKKNKILIVLFCMLILFFFAACDVGGGGGGGGSGSGSGSGSGYTTSNYSTYGSEANPFAISTADHLRQIADISSNSGKDFNGKIIKLMNDIDMSGVTDFYGIGYAPEALLGVRVFKGTFDGNGKKITNLIMDNNSQYVGLILSANEGAVIKNLGIENGSITNSWSSSTDSTRAHTGAIVGFSGLIEIVSSYNIGKINKTATGVLGGNIAPASVVLTTEDCYYLDLPNNSFSGDTNATKLTASEFATLTNFTDFSPSVWQIKSMPTVNGVTSRPVLKGVGEGV